MGLLRISAAEFFSNGGICTPREWVFVCACNKRDDGDMRQHQTFSFLFASTNLSRWMRRRVVSWRGNRPTYLLLPANSLAVVPYRGGAGLTSRFVVHIRRALAFLATYLFGIESSKLTCFRQGVGRRELAS